MDNTKFKQPFLNTVIFLGGLWGLVEATLGHLLHVLGDILPMNSLSGTLLFPIGLFFMIKAMRLTGSVAAVPMTAFVAAILKALTLMFHFVTFRFVRNPTLAILLEGVVVWVVLGSSEWKYDIRLPICAVAASYSWRILFLTFNIVLGLPGIASKPVQLQWQFLLLDGGIDACIIVAACILTRFLFVQNNTPERRPIFRPLPAAFMALAGFGTQAFVGLVQSFPIENDFSHFLKSFSSSF